MSLQSDTLSESTSLLSYSLLLRAKLYDKRDYFSFPIVNFPFIGSTIPAAPVVYVSQLMRYSRACGSYQDFLDIWLLLTKKLLNQGFLLVKLKSSLRKIYGRHHDLVDRYGISVSQMTTDLFHSSETLPSPFLIHDLSQHYGVKNSYYNTDRKNTKIRKLRCKMNS